MFPQIGEHDDLPPVIALVLDHVTEHPQGRIEVRLSLAREGGVRRRPRPQGLKDSGADVILKMGVPAERFGGRIGPDALVDVREVDHQLGAFFGIPGPTQHKSLNPKDFDRDHVQQNRSHRRAVGARPPDHRVGIQLDVDLPPPIGGGVDQHRRQRTVRLGITW